MSKQVQVALLLTGNELMSGDTVDSNSSRIALALGRIRLASVRKSPSAMILRYSARA